MTDMAGDMQELVDRAHTDSFSSALRTADKDGLPQRASRTASWSSTPGPGV